MNGASAVEIPDAAYLRGRILVLLAGASMSIGGPLIRMLDTADPWQFLFYRALAVTATLLVILGWRGTHRVLPAFRAAGMQGVVAGCCLGVAFTGYVFSIMSTTVANTLFLLSAAPFMTAILARVLLGERVSRATVLAILGASVGIALMVGEGAATGALFGDLTALAAALGFAGFSVALRRGRTVDMLPAVCIAGIVSAGLAGTVATLTGSGLGVSFHDLLLCVIYGTVGIGIGLQLYTIGSRHVPAAELTLLSLSEVILGPIWVWIGFDEIPSRLTLAGGAILLASVAGQALSGVVRRPRPPIAVG